MMSGVSPAELASAARKQKKAEVARKSLVEKGKVIKEKSKTPPTSSRSRRGGPPPKLGPAKPHSKNYYVCEQCPTVFDRRYNRDRHVETIHNVPRPGGKPPLGLFNRKQPQLPKLVLPSPKKAEDLFTVSSDEEYSDSSSDDDYDADDDTQTMDEKPADEMPPVEQEEEEKDTSEQAEEEKEDNVSEAKDKAVQVPSCKDPNTNLIQLPLCKEVTVTLFFTSK